MIDVFYEMKVAVILVESYICLYYRYSRKLF